MIQRLKEKKRFFILIFIFGFLFFLYLIFFREEFFLKKTIRSFPDRIEAKSDKKIFEPEVQEKIIKGNSLIPILEPDQRVSVIVNYYNYNEIRRGDVVILSYAGKENPLVKIIKGLPGDSFGLKESEPGYNLLINNEIIKNSEGNPYFFDENKKKILALYEKDYQGKIPPNAFLVLGNNPSGSIDSSYFGLIGKDSILGKVIF